MDIQYGEKEISYLKQKDAKMAEVIDRIGHIHRGGIDDLYAAIINSIIGQQISTKAHKTIWNRMLEKYGEITPQVIDQADAEELQALGTTYRKVQYMKDVTSKVISGEFDPEKIREMSDQEAIEALSSLRGIGVWTAEMLLLFCLQRPDIFSYGDLAILRGLRMVYHHRKITPQLFEKYRRRFSPYCTTASLYLWAVAGGAIEGMKDYAPKKKKVKK